ncbi:helix-turn-helix transcriptional regulator [Pelagibius sp. Alg239-R121]|uniref:helix-turn-helix domain-containing protein n=1 Tax=Pelagibius sp. Alg239-R121 TaxID=2993448 RepID=UPI0024A75A4A|nr:helix-turn-helix transcriptional regulator [Pelagibius sp. Alg239-R121]
MIIVNLDVVLAQRKMQLSQLAEQIGITLPNLSILKSGRARAIRFSTLDAICDALDCQPGDILAFEPNAGDDKDAAANT